MAPDCRSMITDIFVYGTLKRGECRESMWPRRPLQIRPAYVRGQLYDIGPYPALLVDEQDGQSADEDLDWVAGELWSFERSDMDETLLALDEIEQTNQRGYRNLYDQVLVRAYDRPRSRLARLALAYQYSSAGRLVHCRRLKPGPGDVAVHWAAVPDER
ncbi:MAG: gamma-glutamylcyclotransferase family protein [Planctomycetaceae bacterium]